MIKQPKTNIPKMGNNKRCCNIHYVQSLMNKEYRK